MAANVDDTGGTTQGAQAGGLVPFFIIWVGQAVSLLGSELVQFALVWYLASTTGSATVLAVGSVVSLLPKIVLGPFIGALVDRWNRRLVMIAADSVVALATVGLAALFALDAVQVWHIWGLMFVRAMGGAFHSPAMMASTTLMVPEQHLSRIQGLNEVLFGSMGILGPALGALLLDLLPLQAILALDVGTALAAILPLFFVFIPQPSVSSGGDETPPSLLDDVRAGLRFLWGLPGLLMITLGHALIYLLMVPGYALRPILVSEHFRGGAVELAWLVTTGAGGIIVGGLVLSVWGGFKRRVVTMSLATALSGLGWLIVGITPADGLRLAVVAGFFSAVMNSIMVGSVTALGQAVVPPEMQGRVFTLSLAIVLAATPIGLAIAGPVADTFGVRPWFVVGGMVALVLGIGAFFVPAVMSIEDKNGWAGPPREGSA